MSTAAQRIEAGTRFAARLAGLGLTKEGFCLLAGMTERGVYFWLSGDRAIPAMAWAFLRCLETMTPEQLFAAFGDLAARSGVSPPLSAGLRPVVAREAIAAAQARVDEVGAVLVDRFAMVVGATPQARMGRLMQGLMVMEDRAGTLPAAVRGTRPIEADVSGLMARTMAAALRGVTVE